MPIYQQGMNKYQLPNGSYEFKEEYTEDVAELLASTFLHQNDIWKSIELPFSQLREFFLKEINIHMQSQNRLRKLNNRDDIVLNHISIANNQLVGVAMHLQIEEYRHISSDQKQSQVQLFRQLEKQGKELIKAIDINSLESGKYVYATWGAHIKVPGASPMDKIYQASLSYDHMRTQGFKGMVFRSSSQRLVRMHTSMGAQIICELPFKANEKQFKIYLLKQDFENPMMNQIISEAKSVLNRGWVAKL